MLLLTSPVMLTHPCTPPLCLVPSRHVASRAGGQRVPAPLASLICGCACLRFSSNQPRIVPPPVGTGFAPPLVRSYIRTPYCRRFARNEGWKLTGSYLNVEPRISLVLGWELRRLW